MYVSIVSVKYNGSDILFGIQLLIKISQTSALTQRCTAYTTDNIILSMIALQVNMSPMSHRVHMTTNHRRKKI